VIGELACDNLRNRSLLNFESALSQPLSSMTMSLIIGPPSFNFTGGGMTYCWSFQLISPESIAFCDEFVKVEVWSSRM